MQNTQLPTKEISFLTQGSIIYELIGLPNGSQRFIKYDPVSKSINLLERIEANEIVYIPPQNDLVASTTLRLAAYPREYGELEDLLNLVKHFISKYVDLPENFLLITSLYVLLTWVYDCFEVLPYLRVIGDFGTGKSRFLKVVGSLCYKACFAGGATTVSPIFRIIDLYSGVTLVFDEADFAFSGPEVEIVKILNCGYTKGIPVLRTEGDKKRVPTSFNVYGPKLLATRKRYSDLALESRCLTYVMTGKHGKHIPPHLPKDFLDQAREIQNKLLMFRLRYYGQIELKPQLAIKDADSRVNQIVLPILSIIENQDITDQIYSFVEELKTSIQDSRSIQEPAQILEAVIELIKQKADLKFSSVAEKINTMTEHNYAGWEISPAKIGRVNSSIFNLKTRRVNGTAEFIPNKENLIKVKELASQQGLQVDDVDLVALYFGTETNDDQIKLLENVQETLL